MGKMVLVMWCIRGERVLSPLSAGDGVGVPLSSKQNEGTALGNWLVDTESGFLPRWAPSFLPLYACSDADTGLSFLAQTAKRCDGISAKIGPLFLEFGSNWILRLETTFCVRFLKAEVFESSHQQAEKDLWDGMPKRRTAGSHNQSCTSWRRNRVS